MNATSIAVIMGLSLIIFAVPARLKWHVSFVLQILLGAITGWSALRVLLTDTGILNVPFFYLRGNPVQLLMDPLSAYFVLVINFTAITGGLYALGYLKPYAAAKNPTELSLHHFSFLWLHISMLLVCMIREGLAFLIVWEMMAVTSFILVIFESEKKETIRIGINYLIQMHVALVFIMSGFIYASAKTGAAFGFDGLATYFAVYAPFSAFLLFFIGFGIKAGFMPLHSWLPHAHPAAPAHVSGVMSGVIIKMGIYGILRTLTYIHTDLLFIGIFMLVISMISGLLGVMYAIVQHDVKKLLAYHSIENIGIIGIGIGVGLIGLAMNIPELAALGFAGGLLHVLNHSLFKSLLFYCAGSVNQQTHTRHIEDLGGLIKQMPKTGLFFLLGALSICGLPPFNGFISEFLIYSGLFNSLQSGGLSIDLVLLGAFVGLVLIGGLAIFCFTKVFSIVFLGTGRTEAPRHAHEVTNSMIIPKVASGLLIVAVGILPMAFVGPLSKVTGQFVDDVSAMRNTTAALTQVSYGSLLFVGIAALLWIVRTFQQKKVNVGFGPTWGCGYSGADPAVHQYTATSYADNYVAIVGPLVKVKKQYIPFKEDEIFPFPRKFETHTRDPLEHYLVNRPVGVLTTRMEKAAVFQTGKLQHYMLYALLFMVLVFLLTVFQYI